MNKIIEAGDLPEEDQVYLKKDIFGWRIVHPIKNRDGTINWTNLVFGGWRNFTFLIIILLITGFVLWSYRHDIQTIQQACNISQAIKFNIQP